MKNKLDWKAEVEKRMARQERAKLPLCFKPFDGYAIQSIKNAIHDKRSVVIKRG